jgi:hypothetical protein
LAAAVSASDVEHSAFGAAAPKTTYHRSAAVKARPTAVVITAELGFSAHASGAAASPSLMPVWNQAEWNQAAQRAQPADRSSQ